MQVYISITEFGIQIFKLALEVKEKGQHWDRVLLQRRCEDYTGMQRGLERFITYY